MIVITKESETLSLFRLLNAKIDEEQRNLDKAFGIARDISHSDWSSVGATIGPTRYYPTELERLKKNTALLTEQISLRRYLLIKAFNSLIPINVLLNDGENKLRLCFDYWEEQIGSKNQNESFQLKNRFSEQVDSNS